MWFRNWADDDDEIFRDFLSFALFRPFRTTSKFKLNTRNSLFERRSRDRSRKDKISGIERVRSPNCFPTLPAFYFVLFLSSNKKLYWATCLHVKALHTMDFHSLARPSFRTVRVVNAIKHHVKFNDRRVATDSVVNTRSVPSWNKFRWQTKESIDDS